MRFRQFNKNWERHLLEDICEINPKTEKLADDFIYIDLESVVKGELIHKNIISKETAPSRAQRVLRKGDICYQCVRPYQLNNYFFNSEDTDYQWVASTGYAQIRTDNNPLFLYQLLISPRFNREVMLRCTGTSYPAINSNDLGEIEVAICSIEEQNKIACFLEKIDERISTQNKIIKELLSLIKGTNDDLYDKFGNDSIVSLGELGTTYGGLSGKGADDFGEGKPFITYMNVFSNSIVDETMIGYVKMEEGEKQNIVKYGDALFTISSETPEETGTVAVYLGDREIYLNSFCMGYRLNDFDVLIPEYLPYLFSCTQFRKFIFPFAQGSTRFNLNKSDFIRAKFKIPNIVNQKRIVSLLNSLTEKLQTEKDILSTYKMQKAYLLKGMFI